MVAKLWGKQISGPILAVVALVLGFLAAHYANDAEVGVKLVKVSALITGGVSVLLIFVAQYEAWKNEREALEGEKKRQSGSDVRGEIIFGYVDLRAYHPPDKSWRVLDRGCCIHLYVSAVNHNDCTAIFWPQHTALTLQIGPSMFHGTFRQTTLGLTVRDDRLPPNCQMYDFFAGLREPLPRGRPWFGFLCFVVDEFDRDLLTDKTAIRANVNILLRDTLDKEHPINNEVDLLIGRLCLLGEVEKPA
ncbi:MAG TPA: hypothetical protein VN950_04870 [Terriglobales bacterium]|nr:hypothetical protein [Terriglobales bacterium]